MSLKVWLPLLGDFENKGCGDITDIVLVSGNSWATTGKIGAKSLTLTKLQSILGTDSCMSGAKQMSYAFWVKVNTAWETQWLDGIRWYSTDGTINSSSRQEFYTNCTYVGTWYKGGSISGKTFVPGQWTHIAATFNYETGKVNFYLNGVLQGSATNLDTTHYCRGDFYIGDTGTDICENDVRIYDHCLSAAEVHEIAKGLVLHYKLDGPMGGSKVNLLQGSNQLGDTGVYGWIRNGTQTDFSIEKLAGNVIHYKSTLNDIQRIPSICTNVVAPCEFGKTYIYQMELKFDKDVTLSNNVPMHYWVGCRNSDSITNISCNGNLTGIQITWVQNHSGTLAANTWTRIITKFTFPAAATVDGYDYPAIRGFVYGAVLPEAYTGEVNVWMRNCKIEESDVATSWSIAPEDLGIDTTIVTDSSGYEHHGWQINTQTAVSPRYNIATVCNGTTLDTTSSTITGAAYFFGNLPMPASSALTVTWWGKNDAYGRGGIFETTSTIFTATTGMNGADYSTTAIANWDSTFRVYNGSSSVNIFSSFIKDGTWHHHAIVFDGTNVYYYCDSNLKTSGALTGTLPAFNGIRMGLGRAGSVYRQIKESVSDLRIYCTPLLDTDIKLLYNTNSRIDNLGEIHTYKLQESTTRELLQGIHITSGYTVHSSLSNPYTLYSNGEIYFNTKIGIGSDYIPISPSGHTYYYDFDISVNAGNQFYIGFERYDADKTSRSNNACVYIWTTKPTADVSHRHIFGTVNLATDGVNPCAFIALRILNGWSGTNSDVTGIATIHRMSLREVSTIQSPKIYSNGILLTDEFKEYQNPKFYKNGIIEATEFIEI